MVIDPIACGPVTAFARNTGYQDRIVKTPDRLTLIGRDNSVTGHTSLAEYIVECNRILARRSIEPVDNGPRIFIPK